MANPDAATFQEGLAAFRAHYAKRLHSVDTQLDVLTEPAGQRFVVTSSQLRGMGNYPNILYHSQPTKDVIVLIHGLTDAPYYMEAIGRRFYRAGANVVFPLLPAHGLKEPNTAMEDEHLDSLWKEEVDIAVNVARQLGERISIGGLSTGGALSINKVLRQPDQINGGVFLFSAALSVPTFHEFIASVPFLQSFMKVKEGMYTGMGTNPYKYPVFTKFGGLELIQIIQENAQLYAGQKLRQPVFAAHSVHDTAAELGGIVDFMKAHVVNGTVLLIAAVPPVDHASVVLEYNIMLDLRAGVGPTEEPQANPKFEDMMHAALMFFHRYVALA